MKVMISPLCSPMWLVFLLSYSGGGWRVATPLVLAPLLLWKFPADATTLVDLGLRTRLQPPIYLSIIYLKSRHHLLHLLPFEKSRQVRQTKYVTKGLTVTEKSFSTSFLAYELKEMYQNCFIYSY